MKKSVLITLFALTAATATVTGVANAAEGCGPGAHRNAYGHCRANGGGIAITPHGLVIGNFYAGRGYWDGQRYWHHRYHDHGGWRYR